MLAGELEAWKRLEALDPYEVAERTGAEYWEDDDVFVVLVFGEPYIVNVTEREIREIGPHHTFHAHESTHFGLLVPLYLVNCTEAEPSGSLVAPLSLPHGAAFFRGPHELPLEVIAHHFGSNPRHFIDVGKKLGGVIVDHGDAAVTIPAFPRLPVTVILWVGDLEFPARAQILLDETAPRQLQLDGLWAAILMTSEALIQVGGPHH
ncbi:MAG: DUF3786 domain-containing protein [Actinobacteria bacterium]|nr:DUF3786 domain-containing protein [Actinomycetota bacterium]